MQRFHPGNFRITLEGKHVCCQHFPGGQHQYPFFTEEEDQIAMAGLCFPERWPYDGNWTSRLLEDGRYNEGACCSLETVHNDPLVAPGKSVHQLPQILAGYLFVRIGLSLRQIKPGFVCFLYNPHKDSSKRKTNVPKKLLKAQLTIYKALI
jgi:hypothetical protein